MRAKLLCLSAVLVIFSIGYVIGGANSTAVLANTDAIYTKIKIFTSIIETIQRVYIEEKKTDELIEEAIKGVLADLDPHTTYLPAEDFRSWNQNFEGYTGIGISFEIINEQVTIMSVLTNGPANKMGIHSGDRIIEIEGERPPNSREQIAQKLLGPVGSTVTVKVASDNWMAPKTLRLIREKINLESVSRAFLIQPDIGYLKIERFTSSTASELDRALEQLEAKGMEKLLLDLRGNSGGYLNAAIEVADRLIPGGKKLLTTKGRLSSSYQEYYSTAESTRRLYPLIVLIDHGSASASEIVAGAVQDLDRGLIIGQASFGKGLVQSQYRFHDGSALLITTAKYHTPTGRAIQRDYFEKSKDEYYRDAYDEEARNLTRQRGSLPKFKTASGRLVYGGGGITPDIIVGNDENKLSRNLQALLFDEDRHFYTFCEKVARNGLDLTADRERFIREFRVSNGLLRQFENFVKTSDSDFENVDFSLDQQDLRFLLKREMAYIIWDSDARFRINMARDRQLIEALKYFDKAVDLLASADYVG